MAVGFIALWPCYIYTSMGAYVWVMSLTCACFLDVQIYIYIYACVLILSLFDASCVLCLPAFVLLVSLAYISYIHTSITNGPVYDYVDHDNQEMGL